MARRSTRPRWAISLLALALLVGVLGTAGHASGSTADAGHIHAVAFDPGDGALLLGTHEGLYRLGVNDTRPRKVGAISYDLMGLGVLARRSYVASGHPDPAAARRDGLPANLGLIRTDDGGRRWRFVSLRGAADFHVLRARGARVLAFDAVGRRLLGSTNSGRTWRSLSVPDGTTDLALGPSAGGVVAGTADGLRVSTDGGLTYRMLRRGTGPGLVAWPTRSRLVLVDARGTVLVSSDGGRRFSRRASLGEAPAALAATAKAIAVVLESGRLLLSRDGGRAFVTVSR